MFEDSIAEVDAGMEELDSDDVVTGLIITAFDVEEFSTGTLLDVRTGLGGSVVYIGNG